MWFETDSKSDCYCFRYAQRSCGLKTTITVEPYERFVCNITEYGRTCHCANVSRKKALWCGETRVCPAHEPWSGGSAAVFGACEGVRKTWAKRRNNKLSVEWGEGERHNYSRRRNGRDGAVFVPSPFVAAFFPRSLIGLTTTTTRPLPERAKLATGAPPSNSPLARIALSPRRFSCVMSFLLVSCRVPSFTSFYFPLFSSFLFNFFFSFALVSSFPRVLNYTRCFYYAVVVLTNVKALKR